MLSKKEVSQIGHLARIHLDDKEVEPFTKTLADILHYIEKLQKLDVSSVKPTSHVLPLQNVFREDDIKPSLAQDDVMKMAVSRHKGFFKVPLVIE